MSDNEEKRSIEADKLEGILSLELARRKYILIYETIDGKSAMVTGGVYGIDQVRKVLQCAADNLQKAMRFK